LDKWSSESPDLHVTRLSHKVSRKTVVNVLMTLSSILRTAKAWGYCCHPINVSELTLPVNESDKPVRFFTAEQVQQILSVASLPYRIMFAIAAMTGLRAGEVLALQRWDLDFEKGVIQVRRSAWYGRVQSVKTKASRAPVAMPAVLATMLQEYMASTNIFDSEQFLFINRNKRPYAANKVVEYGLWPVLDKLGIPRAGMHAFRHCHASLLIEVGANPKVAQQQMRHSDARITLETYAHVVGDSQRQAVERVGELLRPDAKLCAQMRPN
jgi:integrase